MELCIDVMFYVCAFVEFNRCLYVNTSLRKKSGVVYEEFKSSLHAKILSYINSGEKEIICNLQV